jgi:uncharacterized membrane protein YjfL (UPF0719 family)
MMDMIPTVLLAQVQEHTELGNLWHHMILAVVFSIVGIIVLAIALFLLERLTPFSILKEIGEEHNIAVAIVVASVVLGMSLIIGTAILG